jgi:hypothetical protein
MQELIPSVVNVTQSEAWSKELPPIGFSVDHSGTGLSVEKFPEDDTYLTLFRPPEGSVEVTVKSYKSKHHDKDTLHYEIKSVFSRSNHGHLEAQKSKHINFAGRRRYAKEFTSGKGLSRKRWCALLVPSPDGGPYGLLVLFGIYIGARKSASIPDITEQPYFRIIVDSFDIKGSR